MHGYTLDRIGLADPDMRGQTVIITPSIQKTKLGGDVISHSTKNESKQSHPHLYCFLP